MTEILDFPLILSTAIGVGIILLPVYFILLRKVGWIQVWAATATNAFSTPEGREALFKEIAHGVMRAASERSGALKGAQSRQMDAGIMAEGGSGAMIAGLGAFIPKKYQWAIPLIAPYIQQFMQQQGGQLGQLVSNPNESRGGGGGGQPQ